MKVANKIPILGKMESNELAVFISVLLLAIFIALCGNLWATYSYAQAQKSQQAQQTEKSNSIFRKVCDSFGKTASLVPPSNTGSDTDDIAMLDYLRHQHDVLASLGPDIQCPKGTGVKK